MRKGLIFLVLVSLLLLTACQPKITPEKKEIIVTEPAVDTLADVDGDAFADMEDIDISELDELDSLEAELDDLDNLDFE